MQNTIHFVVQGKGGVGKTLVAVMLAEFFKGQGADLKAFDTDQENSTFCDYAALGARHIPLMNESRTIDARGFDPLMESLLTDEGTFVVDNGADTFSPVLAYMVENDVLNMLRDSGKKVYLHTIVAGGDNLEVTATGFHSIASKLDAPIVLWLNEHHGPLVTVDGKEFTETKGFKLHQDKLHGAVLLQKRNPQTYGADMLKTKTRKLTVDEVMQSPDFALMEKKRIRDVAKDIFGQLKKIEF